MKIKDILKVSFIGLITQLKADCSVTEIKVSQNALIMFSAALLAKGGKVHCVFKHPAIAIKVYYRDGEHKVITSEGYSL